ncbi:putative ribonuclease H-like domain-containing protein [Tanacetum coccineum]|uniref:Ribonuclease H-like domain-containing protein n=1 Tax=Tanacetum coccineum TaxID=301880 RepID=A0ABQ5H3D6_9ASTR
MGLESLEARIVVHKKNEAVYEEDIAFLKYDVQVKDISIKDLKNQLEEALKEKDDLKLKLNFFEESSKNLTKLINSQISAKDKAGLGYDSQINENEVVHSVFNSRESDVDDSPVNDIFKIGEGFHDVPPPYTGNYMPSRFDLYFARLDDSVYKTKISEIETSISKTSKDIIKKPKTVRHGTPIIEDWDTNSDNDSVFRPKSDQTIPKFTKINFVKSDENVKSVNKENTHRQVEYPRKSQSPRENRRNWNGMMTQKLGNGFEFIKKACFVCGSFNHLIKDCDFHDKKMVEKPMLNNNGRVTGQRKIKPVWNNAQRVNHQNKLTHPHPKRKFVPTVVLTKSGQVRVNAIKQSSQRAASISTTRPVNTAAPKSKVNDTLPKIYSYFKAHSPGNPQYTLQDQGIFDSGYSRHMTGNKSFLTHYQEIDGGFVAFGGSPKRVLNTNVSSINNVSSSFTTRDPGREKAQSNEFESVFRQDKDANGNSIYKMFTLVNVVGSSCDNLGGSIHVNAATLPNADLPTDPRMPDLEDTANLLNTGIFSGAYDDEDVGAEADLNNLETTMNVSHIPTTRIHKDYPKEQIICWIEAMQDELLQFRLQKVWRLVDLPKGKHAIGTKWVYRNKKDERGIVVKNKARLVEQGYTQVEGIDYDEVFAPVARIESIRLFLAYALFMGFIVYQMDVKSAFLYGTIKEEVYVCQPPGFEDPQFPDKVYKVEKALYGLHQAPRAWYKTLSTYLLENRFRRGTIDKTLFIKKDKEFKDLMHKKFQMSSMGELTFFLGLQVMQRDDRIFISQDKYIANILKKFDFSSVKTTSTLIETNKALLKDKEAEDVDVHLYRSMIGSLMYLTTSRPDIMFVVCACARFQVTPKVSHLHAVKRIFRYLKGQPKLGLWYPRDSPFDLEAFSDSNYARASLDRKSTIGGCQFLDKRLISWQCKKQTVVANSTTEAEYVAAANCCG